MDRKRKMAYNKEYAESNVNSDPLDQFDKWYTERLNSGIAVPEAVSPGTVSSSGRISVRTVLLIYAGKSYSPASILFSSGSCNFI